MLKSLKVIVPAVLIIILLLNIIRSWKSTPLNLEIVNWNFLVVGFFFLIITNLLSSVTWWQILKGLGEKVSFIIAFRVWVISNTGRLIPGVIWQYLGRIEMSYRALKVPRYKTSTSILIETTLVLVTGIILSFPLIFFQSNTILSRVLFLLTLLLLVILHPKILNRGLSLISKYIFRKQRLFKKHLLFKEIFLYFLLYLINFVLHAAALFFVIKGFVPSFSLIKIVELIPIYSMSWVIGFITIFAPGGLGVTDLSLSYLLSPIIPLGQASAVALLYRLISIIAELIVFTIAWQIKKIFTIYRQLSKIKYIG